MAGIRVKEILKPRSKYDCSDTRVGDGKFGGTICSPAFISSGRGLGMSVCLRFPLFDCRSPRHTPGFFVLLFPVFIDSHFLCTFRAERCVVCCIVPTALCQSRVHRVRRVVIPLASGACVVSFLLTTLRYGILSVRVLSGLFLWCRSNPQQVSRCFPQVAFVAES